MSLPIPQYDFNYKQERILVSSPNEKGIRASDSRISWLGRSIKYQGADGNNHFLNKTSAIKFIKRNTEMKEEDIKKLSNHQIKKIIHDIADTQEKTARLRALVDQNSPEAQYNLGILYEEGGNEKEALKYYKRSANQGYSHAQTRLAILYEKKKDDKNALKYMKLASDQGDSNAQFNLGLFYIEKDKDEAIHFFKKSADQGNPLAQLNLGLLYIEKNDKANALRHLKPLADQGNKTACTYVGLLNSEGLDRDMKAAIKYLKLSENSDAWNLLGIIYEQGEGVEKDLKEAEKYYRLAATQKNPDAIENLKNLKIPHLK